jgi:hypothetical protein
MEQRAASSEQRTDVKRAINDKAYTCCLNHASIKESGEKEGRFHAETSKQGHWMPRAVEPVARPGKTRSTCQGLGVWGGLPTGRLWVYRTGQVPYLLTLPWYRTLPCTLPYQPKLTLKGIGKVPFWLGAAKVTGTSYARF